MRSASYPLVITRWWTNGGSLFYEDKMNINEPAAPGTCDFCGEEGLAIDDIGEFCLYPDKDIEEARLCCWECLRGEPGRAHQKRYGVGERSCIAMTSTLTLSSG